MALLAPAIAALPPLIHLETLPDTADEQVFSFYEAGILTGADSLGSFGGNKPLTRAEATAIPARILKPSLRRMSIQGGNGTIATEEAKALLENRAIVLTAFWEENRAALEPSFTLGMFDMYGPLIVDASLVHSPGGRDVENPRALGDGWYLFLSYHYMPN